MNYLKDIVKNQKSGIHAGCYSACTANKWVIEAVFENNGVETVISREISTQSKFRLNGMLSSIDEIKELRTKLVDIHSQHDSLLLCNSDFQLSLLDDAADNQELLSEYQKSYRSYSNAKNELIKLRQKSINNIGENDYLKFQLDELIKADGHYAAIYKQQMDKEVYAGE